MPFSAEELAPTLRPLLEAAQLPPRAFTDEAVAGWELEHLFLGSVAEHVVRACAVPVLTVRAAHTGAAAHPE